MAAFATVDELETYFGVAAGSLNQGQGQLMLDLAAGAIRGECGGQVIELVEDDEIEIRGSWGRELWLPQRPVVEVTAIAIDNVELPDGSFRASSDGRVTFYRGAWEALDGPGVGGRSYWGGDELLVTVTYTHGLAADDPRISNAKAVNLDLAKRAISTPDAGMIIQEAIGAASFTYSREAAQTIMGGDRRRLRRYKRKNYSVPLGRA